MVDFPKFGHNYVVLLNVMYYICYVGVASSNMLIQGGAPQQSSGSYTIYVVLLTMLRRSC